MPRTKSVSHKSYDSNAKRTARLAVAAKARRRFRPSVAALSEIRRYQTSTNLQIRKAPFQRLVREIAQRVSPGLRVNSHALTAMHEAAEAYMVALFAETRGCASHAARAEILIKDMQLSLRIRGERP